MFGSLHLLQVPWFRGHLFSCEASPSAACNFNSFVWFAGPLRNHEKSMAESVWEQWTRLETTGVFR